MAPDGAGACCFSSSSSAASFSESFMDVTPYRLLRRNRPFLVGAGSVTSLDWCSGGRIDRIPDVIRRLISAWGDAAMTGIPRLMDRDTS